MRRGGVAMLGNEVDEGRSDDDTVGDLGNLRGLFGGADTKADRDGQVGRGFEPRDGFDDARLRRLLLARATVHRPQLLILDEGLDFLDADSRGRFQDLLPELIAAGTHLMVIVHREADAPAGLTHHLHLEGGKVACGL